MKPSLFTTLVLAISILLAGCGGGGAASDGINGTTSNAVATITAAEISTYSDAQIAALGSTIALLSPAALQALSFGTNSQGNPVGQIETISAAQIAALSPAQVQQIGAAGPGGVATSTALIRWLNVGAWSQLASNPAQVAAITAAEVPTLTDGEVTALGTNIALLSDTALEALTFGTDTANPIGQIESISAAQLAALSPAQVRLLGAAGVGGVATTSQIRWLNAGAWSVLGSSPLQVAAITADEVPTLSDEEIIALGQNINQLSNAALEALTFGTNAANPTGQIESISAAQIASLTPAQVRLIGAAGAGGVATTAEIRWLNAGAWSALAGIPLQVAAITAQEVPTLSDGEIAALGLNINQLSLAALGALTWGTNAANPTGQIESISAAQIATLSPAQISAIAWVAPGTGIAYLNLGAFGTLSTAQVGALIPANMSAVTAAELAALTPAAIAGLSPAVVASLSAAQKALLSSPQHAACGC